MQKPADMAPTPEDHSLTSTDLATVCDRLAAAGVAHNGAWWDADNALVFVRLANGDAHYFAQWRDVEAFESAPQFPDTPFPLAPSLVLLGRRGSEAHGTYVPPTDPDAIDDRDLMGVCIPPARFYLGLSSWEGAEAMKGPWDVVLYDFKKFVRLLMRQNPSVIGLLWLEDEDYLHVSPVGRELIAMRDAFRSRRLAHDAFAGYAMSQIKKMRGSEFRGYMGAKRKALVERYGYDTKNAAHLVRLLHMGEEFLRTGALAVRRTHDREMLIAIKRGMWTLERVQKYADDMFGAMREAYAKSVLPDELDVAAIDAFVVRTLRGAL